MHRTKDVIKSELRYWQEILHVLKNYTVEEVILKIEELRQEAFIIHGELILFATSEVPEPW